MIRIMPRQWVLNPLFDYIYHVFRWLVIILGFQILTSGQILAEAFKVVNLVEHFRMHREEGEGMGLIRFIRMHYFDPTHESSDPVKHQQLPLHQTVVHVSLAVGVAPETVSLPDLARESEIGFHSRVASFHPQHEQVSVFQPPRSIG